MLERLGASVPATRDPGIVHGDFKIDNVMVAHDDPAQVIGVLDWEMSTLGDTLADLGVLVSFWDEEGVMPQSHHGRCHGPSGVRDGR